MIWALWPIDIRLYYCLLRRWTDFNKQTKQTLRFPLGGCVISDMKGYNT